MTQPAFLHRSPAVDWFIRRNPLYLLSAALMALGARMLLVTPNAAAGEIGLILLTLGVLQLYEVAVSAILLTLHRFRRSPEDQPSLLLVAALFWTGPLAATVELTARDPRAGIGFAIAAAILALGELRFTARKLGLTFGAVVQSLSGGCVALVVTTSGLLGISAERGPANDVALYAAWWMAALLAILLTPLVRGAVRQLDDRAQHLAVTFAVLVLVATAAHLYAINYAFFTHASPHYVAPLLLAIAVVTFEIAAANPAAKNLAGVAAVIVLAAICLPLGGFDAKFPKAELPVLLHNPMLPVLLMATLVWWFGSRRTGNGLLLHFGTISALVLGMQIWPLLAGATPGFVPQTIRGDETLIRWIMSHRVETATMAGFACVYFAIVASIRRSPRDGFAALASFVAGVASLTLGRVASGDFLTLAAALWAVLIGVHFATRPKAVALACIVSALVALGCAAEFRSGSEMIARLHTAAVPVLCLVVGYVLGRREWLMLAAGSAGVYAVFVAGLMISTIPNPLAVVSVIAAFMLLCGGATVSWHKPTLLKSDAMREVESSSDQ